MAFFLPEPIRGASEGIDPSKLLAHEKAGASQADYIDMMVNSSFTYSVLGMSFYTFAIGGLSAWLPSFLVETRGFDQGRSSGFLALTTFAAAVTGMSIGGWLADRLARSNPRALFLVPGFALSGIDPFYPCRYLQQNSDLDLRWNFLRRDVDVREYRSVQRDHRECGDAEHAIGGLRRHAFLGSRPRRHLVAPLDGLGRRHLRPARRDGIHFRLRITSIGRAADPLPGPPPENWTAGLLVVVPAVALAGVVMLSGARHLPREMALMIAKLKAKPRLAAHQESPET